MKKRSNRVYGEKEQTQKRMFSLKRQIVRTSWLFIIVLALLLITFLISMISSYQKKADEKRTEDMISYGETLEDNLAELRDVIGEIFYQNSDFDGITIYPSVAEKWSHIYDLLGVLRVQVRSNKGIAGLLLYYDSFEQVQYIMNDYVPFGEREILKKTGKAVLENDERAYIGFAQSGVKDAWYNLYMKKASVSIGGCVQLSQGLPQIKDETAVYGVISEGRFYEACPGQNSGEEAEKEINLSNDEISLLQPGKNRVDGKIIYLHDLDSEEISVVEILPENIWLYINKLHVVWMVLILLYFLVAFRLQQFVYYELSRPLQDMSMALENIQEGVWEVQFSAPNRISEIEDVRQSVKTLLAEIEQYKIRFYEEELEKAKIHRQYLQLQLAPHFYTNCLKNAYYMLALKEYDNAEIFLQRLSVHLRYLLQQGTPFVTVSKELEFVNNYVDMQKLMTSKSLSLKCEIDEEAMLIEFPILLLQTFVENSVKYARNAKGSQLQIEISIKLRKTEEGNYLDITIRDNGQGYPGELLEVINQKKPTEKEGLGIGVINLQNRIQIFYGDRASWYFENRGGAVSELILPEKPEVEG